MASNGLVGTGIMSSIAPSFGEGHGYVRDMPVNIEHCTGAPFSAWEFVLAGDGDSSVKCPPA